MRGCHARARSDHGGHLRRYLERLPVDTVKIDRAFITDLEPDRSDTAIVQAVVAFGACINHTVTVAGVGTASHYDSLRRMGCDSG